MKKFLIKVNGNEYEVEVQEVGGVPEVQAAAPVQAAALAPQAPVAAAPAAKKEVSGGAIGAAKISSPMPGTILKVSVNPGDAVKKNQVILILEAMKMENEIVAPNDGTISSINVTKGSAVNAGDLLFSMN